MTVLQVHNFYRVPGGEDRVYEAESELLTRHGHKVARYAVHNDAAGRMSALNIGIRAIWNQNTYREVRTVLREHKPDIVHAHNTFPLISPALHYAAAAEQIPLVQTLHNYRLICPGATLYRRGQVCEDCLHSRTLWPAIRHACYRNSRPATTVVSSMLLGHRVAGTWTNRVQHYIALTEFSKQKFIESGIPANLVSVKPNFLLSDPGIGAGDGGYALFAGRLSEEKGLRTLLRACQDLPEVPLKIAGDGPMRAFVEERVSKLPNVDYLENCGRQKLLELLKHAQFLVFPSEWYEGLPLVIIEALACGTPVLASALGSMTELIQEGVNGRFFQAGNSDSLVNCIRAMLVAAPGMRKFARASYEREYTPERNYELLMNIYGNASSTV
jgi:glycosyltransferase involved in cell wall biosynthesis